MQVNRTFGVILPAAGSGSRYGGGDKLLTDLGGQSVLVRSVGLFTGRPDVVKIVIVTAPKRFDAYREHLLMAAGGTSPTAQWAKRGGGLAFVAGGCERWESVLFGLRFLAADSVAPAYVAVHDAARPLCPAHVIEAAFRGAVEKGGSLPCVPEPATLKRQGGDGCVRETVSRRGLFQAQTPQCFELPRLLAGYEELLQQSRMADLTDDAQVFERMGWPVAITAGAGTNLKITTAEDAELARAMLATQVRQ